MYVCMYVCVYLYIYIYTYAFICMYVCIYIYVIYTYMIYIYIHTYTLLNVYLYMVDVHNCKGDFAPKIQVPRASAMSTGSGWGRPLPALRFACWAVRV